MDVLILLKDLANGFIRSNFFSIIILEYKSNLINIVYVVLKRSPCNAVQDNVVFSGQQEQQT